MSNIRLKGGSLLPAKFVTLNDELRQTRNRLEQAENLRQRGDLAPARALCEPLVVRYGDYFGALHTLGLIYSDMRNYSMALGFLVRAAMLNPLSWTTLTALSGVYLRLGASEMAAQTLEQARAIQPREAGVLLTLGEIYRDEREYELAQSAYRNAVALEPSLEGAVVGLGTCCTHLGQYAEAAELFEGLLKRGVLSLSLVFALNLLPQSVVSVDVLKVVDKIVKKKPKNEPELETDVDFIRAAFLDKAGRHAEAWEHMVRGNRALFNRKDAEELGVNQETSLKSLRDNPASAHDAGKASKGAGINTVSVFVLGPSRSGKTSMETLLATLDGVKRGYENPIVENAVRRTFQSSGFLNNLLLEALPPQFFSLCRDLYIDELARRAGSAAVFTNTHPAHIYNAGRIASVFPNVRFVFVKRNLEDNALRIYMRKYRRGNAYGYDLKTIRDHITRYHEMMDLLAEQLPDQVRIIRYEDMIADPAAALSVAAELCGLEVSQQSLPEVGDDRGCAEPYRAFMATALQD